MLHLVEMPDPLINLEDCLIMFVQFSSLTVLISLRKKNHFVFLNLTKYNIIKKEDKKASQKC